jgi:uncharacterized coiled-coil DUF342 family protein
MSNNEDWGQVLMSWTNKDQEHLNNAACGGSTTTALLRRAHTEIERLKAENDALKNEMASISQERDRLAAKIDRLEEEVGRLNNLLEISSAQILVVWASDH